MKYYLKTILRKLLTLPLIFFHLFPIRENRILFLSLEGGSLEEYNCNPKAFFEYLNREHPDVRRECVWLFRHPEQYRQLPEMQHVRLARHFSPKGLYYALTSRVVITNGGYLTWFPFRKGQIRVNTWHGGGDYKRLENDAAGANRATEYRMAFLNRNTRVFLSSSELFSRDVIRGAFRYRGEILPSGMPRNDLFFSEERSRSAASEARRACSVPEGTRVVLYAPTFRDSSSSYRPFSARSMLDDLEAASGESWCLLLRRHNKSSGSSSAVLGSAASPLDPRIRDVSRYPDTQALLAACDLLVTDYSSILWDFSLTGRPAILYTPDLPEYEKEPGFYLDIRRWGYPVCTTREEFSAAVAAFTAGELAGCSEAHRRVMGGCEDGHACDRLYEWLVCHGGKA